MERMLNLIKVNNNRSNARHRHRSWRLRRSAVERVAGNDAHAVMLPFRGVVVGIGRADSVARGVGFVRIQLLDTVKVRPGELE